jgi:hypothetical protein
MVGTFRLDAESRRGYLLLLLFLLLPLSRPGGHYDDYVVSVTPVYFSGFSSQKYMDNLMSSSGYQLKSRCQVHGARIDEHKQFGEIGIVIRENLHIASLEYPNVPFAETILFEVIPEDFEWECWGAEHRFIHLCTLK